MPRGNCSVVFVPEPEVEWLFIPIDPSRDHDVGFYLSWHARLMVLAWSFLVPIAVIAARFFKLWPRQTWPEQLDSQNWWIVHRLCNYIAVLLMAVAVYFIQQASLSAVLPGPHAVLATILIGMVVVQVLSGWLRGSKGGPTELAADGTTRGDHFDMSLRRVIFEHVHKLVGYLALLLSVAVVLSGLWQSNAPVWIWITIIAWWIVLIVIFLRLQISGYTIDTYQAIWGPDRNLPGNLRRSAKRGPRD